jgi:hypothetical protein
MPFISVTRLRIRSVRFLPSFALNIFRTRNQVKNAVGFQGGSLLADRARVFWTMTAWDSQESMRNYMTTGSHRKAMPRLPDWCDEASVVHWIHPDSSLPSWIEADKRMRENGRPSKVRFPSPQHEALDYRTPRAVTAEPISPAKRWPSGN